MARDEYYGEKVQLSDPANQAEPITPSDVADLTSDCRSLFIGEGGDINMAGQDDTAPRIWRNVPSGSFIFFRARRIYDTDTTASDILALS